MFIWQIRLHNFPFENMMLMKWILNIFSDNECLKCIINLNEFHIFGVCDMLVIMMLSGDVKFLILYVDTHLSNYIKNNST